MLMLGSKEQHSRQAALTNPRLLRDNRSRMASMKARPSTPRRGKRIRILIADREEVFRIGLQGLFGAEDDLQWWRRLKTMCK